MPVQASTLERIRSSGVLRIGFGEIWPFAYQERANGEVKGYAIDICKQVANEIKQHLGLARLEIYYVPITTGNRMRQLDQGVYDIECSASTNHIERQHIVAFSSPFFFGRAHYVSLAKNRLQSLIDLKGRSVSAVLGSFNITLLGKSSRELQLNLSVVPMENPKAAFDLVTQGWVAAAVMDDIVIKTLVALSEKPSIYTLSEQPLSEFSSYAVMMRREDHDLLEVVNRALHKMYVGPELSALYQRWFMQELPASKVNLNLPMSAELQQVIEQAQQQPLPTQQ